MTWLSRSLTSNLVVQLDFPYISHDFLLPFKTALTQLLYKINLQDLIECSVPLKVKSNGAVRFPICDFLYFLYSIARLIYEINQIWWRSWTAHTCMSFTTSVSTLYFSRLLYEIPLINLQNPSDCEFDTSNDIWHIHKPSSVLSILLDRIDINGWSRNKSCN